MQDVEILRVVVRENFSEAVGLVIRSFFHEDTNIKILQLVDRLVADIIEITEDLMKSDTPEHALVLMASGAQRSSARRHEGRLEHGSGSEYSGTYAKTC